MLFGKYVNKYYKKYFLFFLIGVITLIIVDIAQTFIPRFLGQIIDENNELIVDLDALGKIIGGIFIVAGTMFVGRAVWRLSIFRASTGIAAGLRKEMFAKAERLSASYYHETKVGNIMNWFTSDIEEISDFFGWGTVMLVDAIFLSASVIVSMIRLNVWLTLLAAIPIGLIVIWGALVDKFMAKYWENRQKEYDRLYDFAQENFTGIRVIKAFVKQNQEIIAFSKVARKNQQANVSFARLNVFFDVIIEIFLVAQMGFLLGFGGYLVYSAASGSPAELFGHVVPLTVGQLMEFVGYVDLIIWPMIALGQIVSMRSRAKGSLRRISAFLDTPEDIVNPENGIQLGQEGGTIEFRDFSFAYPSYQEEALHHVSLTIRQGEHIGIVGKVGSGKTTLVNVLLRLYNLEKGQVLLDGHDIMDCDIRSVRDFISYAPQDNFLYSDKIEGNIAFSSPFVDRDKAIEAARFADVDSNIAAFPKGYETVSGERGVTLSGGQKQRISIARAQYKDAPVMILDDCVSAVDVKTEEAILSHIASQRKGRTTLLIASRVSSVAHMDKIIVLDEGKVVGFDTPEALAANCPVYARMVYLQELEKEVEGGPTRG
ncbi:MAG: ABC transporter ATP-binding protein [Bacilli bacterium]|nr:ABC transporter ATP-binding protein [Bacilli bacterium]